jgi:hypothetical protein
MVCTLRWCSQLYSSQVIDVTVKSLAMNTEKKAGIPKWSLMYSDFDITALTRLQAG